MSRHQGLAGIALLAGLVLTAGQASANAPATNGGERAVTQAADAFGLRIGVEQIGLYSESQVRGFSLQDSGAYRLGGAYFVRVGNLVDPVLGGAVNRVGFNALAASFPTPTGIVDYRLRSPVDAPGHRLEVSAREFGGGFVEAISALASEDRSLGLLIGGQANHGVSSAGFENASYRLGAIAEWRPSPGAQLRGFVSVNDFDFQGFYGVATTGEALPPPMPHPGAYLPTWGDHDGRDYNAGLIARAALTPDLEAGASAIYSRLDLDASDYVLMSLDGTGRGHATVTHNRPRVAHAWALSADTAWRPTTNGRLFAEARGRIQRNLVRPAVSQRIDGFDQQFGLVAVPEPSVAAGPAASDRIGQLTLGLGYEHALERLRLKASVQRAVHTREYTPIVEPAQRSEDSPWLFDASAVVVLTPRWTAFASAVQGLEDSGAAPSNAANRNELLPAVRARQAELGLRGQLTPAMTLIASAFVIEKPAAGFDDQRYYRLVGELRHQGVELSLAGRPRPDLTLVAGAAVLDARRSGPLVDKGQISAQAPGVSSVQAMTGFAWDTPAPGLSLDAQFAYQGERRVRGSASLMAPAFATVDLGLAYAFQVAERDLSLRLRLLNLLDNDAWVASRSETLDRLSRRSARLSLSLRL